MNPSYDAASLQLQITQLEQEYQFALLQGKEFEYLKQIRLQLNTLRERITYLVNSRN